MGIEKIQYQFPIYTMQSVRDGIRIRYECLKIISSEFKNKTRRLILNPSKFTFEPQITKTNETRNLPFQTAQNPTTQPEPMPKRNL